MKPRVAEHRFTTTTSLLTVSSFLPVNNFLEKDQGKNTTLSTRLHNRHIQEKVELEHGTISPWLVLLVLAADTSLKQLSF